MPPTATTYRYPPRLNSSTAAQIALRPIHPSTTKMSACDLCVSTRKDSPYVNHPATSVNNTAVIHQKPTQVGHKIVQRRKGRSRPNDFPTSNAGPIAPAGTALLTSTFSERAFY